MAADVVSQSDWFSWSLNQLAREFGIARETVQARLRSSDVKPSGERRGFPVYRVSAAAKAILSPPASIGALTNDPDRMSPKERRDYIEGSIAQKKLDEINGVTISVIESREQMALIAKTGLHVLETLPDILERDYSLDAKIISGVESKIDTLREQWANILEEIE
jgi:hypothetical protein